MEVRLIVTHLDEFGAAKQAGVRTRDIVVLYGVKEIRTANEFTEAMRSASADDANEVPLVVLRDDELLEIKVPKGVLGISFNESSEAGYIYTKYFRRVVGIDPAKVLEEAMENVVIDENLHILLSTVPNIEGYRIVKHVDVVTADCFFSMDMFSETVSAFQDLADDRTDSIQQLMRKARRICMRELRTEAKLIGANAVIGIDIEYSQIDLRAGPRIFVVASGTAVVIEQIAA